MEKNSSENKPCVFCSNTALANTDPPVCSQHLLVKTASTEPGSLKELESWDKEKEVKED